MIIQRKERKRNRICVIPMLVLLIVLIAADLYTESRRQELLCIRIESENAPETIGVWDDEEEKLYVFLPSYARAEDCYLQPLVHKLSLNGAAFDRELCLSELDWEKPGELTDNRTGKQYQLVILQSANVATMYLDTASGSMDYLYESKENKETCRIILLDEKGRIDYAGDGADTINGRGNTTWSMDKKPFRVKLSSVQDLLGMGEAENWVLLSNCCDETNLCDKLIYDLAAKTGLVWSPQCEYVDLYLNGQYNGLYLLSEKVEYAPGRVEPTDPDEDFMFELIQQGKLWDSDVSFSLDSGRIFRVDEPEELSDTQLLELRDRTQALENAILAGDLSMLDLASWVERFLIDEIFLNFDEDLASSYYVLDVQTGIFSAGPIWDYDLAFGNQAGPWIWREYTADIMWGLNRLWYRRLYENETFFAELVETYRTEFVPLLHEMLEEEMPMLRDRTEAAGQMNLVRWNSMFQNDVYTKNIDYGQRVENLFTFLRERMDYLDEVWLSGEEYCIVEYCYDTDECFSCELVKRGECVASVPKSADMGARAIPLWYDRATGEVWDLDTPVTEDISLRAMALYAEESEDTETSLRSWALNHKSYLFCAGSLVLLSAIMLFEPILCARREKRKRDL